jgi:hypothetical protein
MSPSTPPSLRRALLTLCLAAGSPLLLVACQDEEARSRSRLAGEYVSTIDLTLAGERHRERHVLRLTKTGYWVRAGGTQLGDRPLKVTRDSGEYRIHGDTLLILRSQLQERPLSMRYTVSGDTIRGYNFAALGLNKESAFIRRTE